MTLVLWVQRQKRGLVGMKQRSQAARCVTRTLRQKLSIPVSHVLVTVTVLRVCHRETSGDVDTRVILSLGTWPLQVTGVGLYLTSDISHLPHCPQRSGLAHNVVLPA
ncbi:hypothetical protein E2C01_032969 [Portunus trituberculatus]|uniref:Uncharacterized protein n=1 Tax=Portunus trituberculatus TaxID=210409 RepID=A0A5B7F2X7_PORTR|nr:hypothetical protein [Portunus trituberculatus]